MPLFGPVADEDEDGAGPVVRDRLAGADWRCGCAAAAAEGESSLLLLVVCWGVRLERGRGGGGAIQSLE